MLGPHVEQAAAGAGSCLKTRSMADAADMPSRGSWQKDEAHDVPPEYLQSPLRLPGMQPQLSLQVSQPFLGVDRSGSHAGSDEISTDALATYEMQQTSRMGLSSPQLQPILALFNAAHQAKRGLLIRAASCEVPEGSGRKLPHKRTPNVLYKVLIVRVQNLS